MSRCKLCGSKNTTPISSEPFAPGFLEKREEFRPEFKCNECNHTFSE